MSRGNPYGNEAYEDEKKNENEKETRDRQKRCEKAGLYFPCTGDNLFKTLLKYLYSCIHTRNPNDNYSGQAYYGLTIVHGGR